MATFCSAWRCAPRASRGTAVFGGCRSSTVSSGGLPARVISCAEDDAHREVARRRWIDQATTFETSNPGVTIALRQAIDDLAGLRLDHHDHLAQADGRDDVDAWVPAGGIPWFVSLFGRDALTVSLQTLAVSPRFALGSLRALAALQADAYDDERDMQPGKIEHENTSRRARRPSSHPPHPLLRGSRGHRPLRLGGGQGLAMARGPTGASLDSSPRGEGA